MYWVLVSSQFTLFGDQTHVSSPTQGADASTDCAACNASSVMLSPALTQPTPASSSSHETVRHLLFGRIEMVQHTIKLLHKLNYAEPNDWSRPMPTGQPDEVVAVLTKKVKFG